jgi:DNA polymerase III delta subunit
MARKPATHARPATAAEGKPAKGPTPTGKLDATCWVGVLAGSDVFLKQQDTAVLKAALTKAHGEVDVVQYDGATAATRAADVLDDCRSFGLIAGHKLVVVDNAESLIKEETRPLFERYVQSLIEAGTAGEAPGATLVLRSSNWRAGKLDALIEKVGVIKKCEPPSHAEAVRWVQQSAKNTHKASIEPPAAELLVERVGPDLARLGNEVAKLAAAAIDPETPSAPPTITRSLVAEFVGMSREEQVWGIQSTLLEATAPAALSHLKYLIEVSRQPTVMISYALIDLSRKVHALSRGGHNGQSPDQIAQSLKLWGPSKQLLLDAAKRTTPNNALAIFRIAIESDLRQKTGLGESEQILERAFLRASTLLHSS